MKNNFFCHYYFKRSSKVCKFKIYHVYFYLKTHIKWRFRMQVELWIHINIFVKGQIYFRIYNVLSLRNFSLGSKCSDELYNLAKMEFCYSLDCEPALFFVNFIDNHIPDCIGTFSPKPLCIFMSNAVNILKLLFHQFFLI